MTLGTAVVIAALMPGPNPPTPQGPDTTQFCMENGTPELLGVWISQSIGDLIYPLEFRVVEPTQADCARLTGHSQSFWITVGKGERVVPGTVPIFPDRVASKVGAHCPNGIMGGLLRFKVTKLRDKYQCKDAR